jgi:RNA polymerase sigma-70 factor (ECF subfamily)
MKDKEDFFRSIVSEHQDRIYRLCWSYVQNRDDRKDLYQNILIKMWKGLDSLQDKSSVSTWIFRLSVNTSIDYIRRNKKHRSISSDIDITNVNIIDRTNDIEGNLILSENIKILHNFINQLSFIDKTLIYFYLEDLKYREIAEILGISEKNVSIKLHRIKRLLKEYFKDIGE